MFDRLFPLLVGSFLGFPLFIGFNHPFGGAVFLPSSRGSNPERPRVDEEEMRARCQDVAEAFGGDGGWLMTWENAEKNLGKIRKTNGKSHWKSWGKIHYNYDRKVDF